MLTQYLWIALAAVVVHVFEEVWTGFLTWYRGLFPKFEHAVNIPWFTFINTMLVTYGLIVVNWETGPTVVRLSFIAVLILNAFIHLIIGLVRRRYNPGMASAILLYLPIGVLTIRGMVGTGVTWTDILLAFVVAAGIHGLLPVTLLVSKWIVSRTSAHKEIG
ncbi:HXXEE domain-containing protein [bacterium]|nr:HXXEE domain-containing protein [bacterium]